MKQCLVHRYLALPGVKHNAHVIRRHDCFKFTRNVLKSKTKVCVGKMLQLQNAIQHLSDT